MGSEIELNAGIVKLKLELSQFTSAIGALAEKATGANEKEQARSAMKEMITEVRKVFDLVVDKLDPLYKLTTEASFIAEFDAIRGALKSASAKNNHAAITHCHIVREKFELLSARRAWMQNLPPAQDAYDKLETVCKKWLFHDESIVRGIDTFFQNLNAFTDEVEKLKRTDPARGLKMLTVGLSLLHGTVTELQKQLGELEVIAVPV